MLRQNIEAFSLQGHTKILRRDACQLGIVGTMEPFDLVFADPPYGRRMGKRHFCLHFKVVGLILTHFWCLKKMLRRRSSLMSDSSCWKSATTGARLFG